MKRILALVLALMLSLSVVGAVAEKNITVTLTVYRVLMGFSVLAAVFFLVGVQKKKLKTKSFLRR